ncbi:MAG: hypothetical protein DRP10_01820 [Candidatus Aenigmatarchaeota archaeon]|nr:MAG: hypothetical protein DRP10_01820 [Candidatus Aenigmarchaeota archaeon]
MKILKRDKEGITIIPENLNDLWFLYNRIDNSVIEQKTLRTKSISRGGEIVKGKKVPQIVAIKIEKKKWERNKIRVTGKIVSEKDKNKYHSFNLEIDKKLVIFTENHFFKLKPKEENYEILICLIDKKLADLRIYKSGKLREVKKINSKGRENEFYKEVANILKKENRKILLAGPGNTKDKVAKLLNKEIVIDNLSSSGEKGFKELLKRGSIRKIIEKLRDEQEEKTVKKFLVEIKKNQNKVCYGSSVETQIERIKEILVLSSLVPKYEKILFEAEKNGTKIYIVDDEKEYCREIRVFEIIGICWY